jgi:hypothetical protein
MKKKHSPTFAIWQIYKKKIIGFKQKICGVDKFSV